MEDKVLIGQDRQILEIPSAMWKQHLTQIPQHSRSRLSFMTDQHHQVRYFVVRELVKQGKPVEPALISEMLKIPLEQESPFG